MASIQCAHEGQEIKRGSSLLLPSPRCAAQTGQVIPPQHKAPPWAAAADLHAADGVNVSSSVIYKQPHLEAVGFLYRFCLLPCLVIKKASVLDSESALVSLAIIFI